MKSLFPRPTSRPRFLDVNRITHHTKTKSMGTYLIPILSVFWVASSFGQWAPQTPRLSSDSTLLTLGSFWTVDSDVEGRSCLAEAAPLGLTRSQFLDRNIVGQEVLAKEEGSFMATFLVSRNLPWKIELVLGDLGIVNLTPALLAFLEQPQPALASRSSARR